MSTLQILRALVNKRLIAAADEIFGVFENSITVYEEEIVRQRQMLDVLKLETKKHEADAALHRSVCKEEVSSEQQERSPSLDQDDPESPLIKEEQEELTARRGHGVEHLQVLEEADINKLMFTPVPVNSEDYKGKPQSSELYQTRDPLPSTSAAQIKTEPDEEYSWLLSSDCSVIGTDESGEWEESGGTSGSNTLKSKKLEKGQNLLISNMFKKTVEHLDPTENFQHHLQAHRTTCNICGERCTCNLDFQKHLNISQTREKPFCCKDCGKQFAGKKNLNVHMRTHTGEKPFRCTYCGKSFRTTSTLKVHMRTHTGEKPFCCTFCDQRFCQSNSLRVHMRKHTGEKLFSCTTWQSIS